MFKSPPRIVGVTRTVRHRADGQAVVAVAFRNRPPAAVVADLIDGVMLVNEVEVAQASRLRDDLWDACGDSVKLAA